MGLPPELIPRRYRNNYCDSDYYESDEDDSDWEMNIQPPEIKSLVGAVNARDLDKLRSEIERHLQAGKSLDYDDHLNSVPLMQACMRGWVEGVKLLLEHGADPNVQHELSTPLFACCIMTADSAYVECASLLLKHGADPNVQNQFGSKPLMEACWANAETLVDFFLSCPEVDIHAKNPHGQTALFFAEKVNNPSIVDKLIQAGIDPLVKAYDGTIAEDHRPVVQPEHDLAVDYCFTDCLPADFYDPEKINDDVPVERFLSDVKGGLPSKVFELIGRDLPEANLLDILSFDEERLKRCGIKLSYHRREIINLLRQNYLLPWTQKSIPPEKLQNELSLESLGDIVYGALCQQTYMQGMLNHLKQTIPTRSAEESQKLTLVQLVDFFVAQRSLRLALLKLQRELRNVEKCDRMVESKKSWISKILDVVITAIAAPIRYMILTIRYATEFD